MSDINATNNKVLKERDNLRDPNEPRVCRLWLVRHGVTLWNLEQRLCGHHDIPLSDRGYLQARWLARRLRLENICAIYSSDLRRAYETARLIADQQPASVPLHISPVWREMSFGDWEGLTYQQIATEYKNELSFFTDPVHSTPPNGESFPHLVQRICSAFANLA